MTKILFYLPAISPPWFNDGVVHLIRAAAQEAEVHVIAPVFWNWTGLGEAELATCLELDTVNWIILDAEDHPSYRTSPDDPSDVIAYAEALDPDYVFCRSADVFTPMAFPGKVVFLMEGEYAPSTQQSVPFGGRRIISGPRFNDFGLMPQLEAAQRDWLIERTAPIWDVFEARAVIHGDRASYLNRVGLPTDRKIIALPLQCQRADNLWGPLHGNQMEVDDFVAAVVEALDPDCLIAVTVHPVDRRQLILGPIGRIANMDPDRVRIVHDGEDSYQGEATERLVRHCDGMILAESKAIAIGAWLGKPVVRLIDAETAPWVNAYRDLPSFAAALRSGTPLVADQQAFRLWYAFHFANNAFVPTQTSLADLLDRVDQPVNPDRWERALAWHLRPAE